MENFDVKIFNVATKFADAMIKVIQDDNSIIEDIPDNIDAFCEMINGIFCLKLANYLGEIDGTMDFLSEKDKEAARLLKLMKIFK